MSFNFFSIVLGVSSLVVVAAVLPMFGLPEAGLLLILGIDHFLDMGRTATNVVGNAVACTAVARWEGVLGIEEGEGRAAMPVSSPVTLEIETPPVSKT